MSITNSKGVNKENCDGVNSSRGVCSSSCVHNGHGLHSSQGVFYSFGVNLSESVFFTSGVCSSQGVCSSRGVRNSFGVFNSHGVDHALFLADKETTYSIFGKEVSLERFEEVKRRLYTKLGGWFPKFNKAFELYLKAGSDWEKMKEEAWKDMPKEAIEYVKSLEEFDAAMFKRITGIDVNEKCGHEGAMNFCPNC
jgi:hypothetical protein